MHVIMLSNECDHRYPMHVIMLSNACINHRYQVKKTPEEIEREIKAQEAELQKLLQESVGFVVFFRIFLSFSLHSTD